MSPEICACSQPKLSNGNCPVHKEDGLPLQCVGVWADDKHDYLARYIEATWAARAHYVQASDEHPRPGGAAYIDLFAGPGRARIRTTGKVIDGSPLIAGAHQRAPFSKLILCELEPDNVKALAVRTAAYGNRVRIVPGDCARTVDQVIGEIPQHGLNFALVDPFAPSAFRWSILEKLAKVKRMDLLIHFPTNSIKRNFHNNLDFDAMVGTKEWRADVRTAHDVPKLVDHLRNSLGKQGYSDENVRSIPIKNTKEGLLYHLVFATKDRLGNKIWNSIVSIEHTGQRNLF